MTTDIDYDWNIREHSTKKHRSFVFTCNNYTDDTCKSLFDLFQSGAKYLVYGKEIAPKTGTPHLQGYISFKNSRSFKAIHDAITGSCWMKVAKGTATQNRRYCSKSATDDNPIFELGDIPSDSVSTANKNNERYKEALLLAREGKLEEIAQDYSSLHCRFQPYYERQMHEHAPKPSPNPHAACGIWLYGGKNTGKTYSAINSYNCWVKDISKSFDGYPADPHTNICLEEVEPQHGPWLGYFLKQWTNPPAFKANIKYGTRYIRPRLVVVTSNFLIEEIFTDLRICDPLKDRFKVIPMLKQRSETRSHPADDDPTLLNPYIINRSQPIINSPPNNRISE